MSKINSLTVSKLLSSITELLDSYYRNSTYHITSLNIESGENEQDKNFLSSIYKVYLTTKAFTNCSTGKVAEENKFNFICKSTIVEDDEEGNNLEKYYWSILFAKEKLVYEYLQSWPSLLGHEIEQFFPKMYHCYSEGEDYSCIILDDLVSIGYYIPKTLGEVGEGVSLQECQLIMKNLARLHALSLVAEAKQGGKIASDFEICTTELLFSSAVEPAVKQLTNNSYQGFISLVEKYRCDLLPHLKRIDDDENIWDRLCELVKPGKSSFSCFCHGDPRLNNIFIEKLQPKSQNISSENDMATATLFINGNGSSISKEGKNLRFIDFQLTRYASPVTDLQYAIVINTSRAFREKHTDTLLENYYDEFKSVLARFPDISYQEGVEDWTLEKLQEEYKDFAMYGFLVSVILLPILLLRPVDIDKSMSQMTKAERSKFFTEGRADLVLDIGSKNDYMRERLFELCDEMLEKNVISSNASSFPCL